MFGDTDLPLALIMEEILGWEKKPQDNEQDEKKRLINKNDRGAGV